MKKKMPKRKRKLRIVTETLYSMAKGGLIGDEPRTTCCFSVLCQSVQGCSDHTCPGVTGCSEAFG